MIRLCIALVASSLVLGFYLRGLIDENHYNNELLAQIRYKDVLITKLEMESKTNYEEFKKLSNSKPPVITERVYVKANCPSSMPTDTSRDLGTRDTEPRAELHPETIRGVTEVTHTAEVDMLKCQAVVDNLIKKINLYNQGVK